MVDFIILNELSLPIGKTEEEVNQNLGIFIKLLRRLKTNKIDSIRTFEDIRNIEVTPTKKMYEYISSICDRDFRVVIKSFIANRLITFENPLYSVEEYERKDVDSFQYKYGDKSVMGLGAADIFQTLSISFDTDDKWKNTTLTIDKEYLDEDGYISVIKGIEVKNIYCEDSVDILDEYFKTLFSFKFPIDRKNFNELKDLAFKKIKFCKEIDNQVNFLDSEIFNSFLQKLILIELEIKNINNFNYSRESDTVRNTPKLNSLRTFSHTDFGDKYFDKHLKSFPGGYRMYFLEEGGLIYIGYIGKHLATKKY